jgi:hypothetical protein
MRAFLDPGGNGVAAAPSHASGRPLVASPAIPSSTPTAPMIKATIGSVVVPPPPSEETPSTKAAGCSDPSGPAHSTTEPSE